MTDASEQPVALVTGAGSGVGRDTALLLAHAGHAVALVGRTAKTLDETLALIRDELGPDARALPLVGDVSKPDAVCEVIEQTRRDLGRIDALANVAGSAPLQPIEQITDALLDDCLASNLKSVVYTTRAVWPYFQAQKSGVIVNVSSLASLDPFTGFNVYGAAKAGVNTFTKATADEGRKFNIRAYAVAPGAIETGMLRSLFPTDLLPEDQALDPTVVAGVIRDLITGDRDLASGETLALPSADAG